MKILLTGSSGMLGRALARALSAEHEVLGLDLVSPDAQSKTKRFIRCDLTDRETTITTIIGAKADAVIHAAGYTDVDGCQNNPQKSHIINALGTETVALACQQNKTLLIYISTDFVFDGEKQSPYLEDDQPNPISIYGQSKWEGEKYVQSLLENWVIIRSSWLFGAGGKNFVDTILAKAREQTQVKVVNDQFGSPTYTCDLALAMAKLIALPNQLKGIYHITNSGSCSWYQLACAIKEMANFSMELVPVNTEQYPSPTKRPKMSVLENRRYCSVVGQPLRSWQEALKEYLLNERKKFKQ